MNKTTFLNSLKVQNTNLQPMSASMNSSPMSASMNSSPMTASMNSSPMTASMNQSPMAASMMKSPMTASMMKSPMSDSMMKSPMAVATMDWNHPTFSYWVDTDELEPAVMFQITSKNHETRFSIIPNVPLTAVVAKVVAFLDQIKSGQVSAELGLSDDNSGGSVIKFDLNGASNYMDGTFSYVVVNKGKTAVGCIVDEASCHSTYEQMRRLTRGERSMESMDRKMKDMTGHLMFSYTVSGPPEDLMDLMVTANVTFTVMCENHKTTISVYPIVQVLDVFNLIYEFLYPICHNAPTAELVLSSDKSGCTKFCYYRNSIPDFRDGTFCFMVKDTGDISTTRIITRVSCRDVYDQMCQLLTDLLKLLNYGDEQIVNILKELL